LRAQIDAVVEVGLAPRHLDWHCLADGGRADILDLTMALAHEYGLAARVWLDCGRRKARQQGKPVLDTAFLDSYRVGIDDKPATYAGVLRDLPLGLNEWAIHPAHGTEQSQSIEPTGWQVRKATTRSSPRQKHARSSIVKASPSSTTGHCNRPGTRSRVPLSGGVLGNRR
jgi:chitin disaccharide deacetylase